VRSQPVPASDALITFSEFPVGTHISNQYQPEGILFGGDSPFITTDGANPTSPVLSGTPLFNGSITGTFVTPGGKLRTVSRLSLDVGYIDTPGTVQVTALGANGKIIKTVLVEQLGIVPVTIQGAAIASFSVGEVSQEPAGFAIDNVSFPLTQNFSITGKKSLPKPSNPPDPASEFAQGSAQLAKTCSSFRANFARTLGQGVARGFDASGAPDGAALLRHFLGGTGQPVDMADGSALSGIVKNDPVFQALDKVVQNQAKQLLDSGKLTADVTSVLYDPDFSNAKAAYALQAAFGGTQGVDVSGSGKEVDGYYDGNITYTIRDIYGFYAASKFLGVGPEMHYLQGVCGAPWYAGGAHWFPDSVTVTVPFHQPIG
jgi:hypothetical protein